MVHGEHHIHQRKRIHQLHEKYPHPNPKIKFLDNLCMISSVIMPFTTVPQIYKIFYYKDAIGISLMMWISYSILCIPMLLYGYFHKIKPILVLNLLWLIANSIIITGILIYG